MKTVKERETLDLLDLVCQLSGRCLTAGTKEMHDAYFEARKELESRILPKTESKAICYITAVTDERGNNVSPSIYAGLKGNVFAERDFYEYGKSQGIDIYVLSKLGELAQKIENTSKQ